MTDVWSFGVTLWEILGFARRQPFDNLSDEQVIENLGHCYCEDGNYRPLSPPPNSPKEIIDLMFECWNHDEKRRPTAVEIHMFLARKNKGFNPDDENSDAAIN